MYKYVSTISGCIKWNACVVCILIRLLGRFKHQPDCLFQNQEKYKSITDIEKSDSDKWAFLVCIFFFTVNVHVSLPPFAFRFGVYVPLCCFHQEGGKSQAAAAECDYPADHQQNELAEAPFFRPRDFFFLLRENLREQFSSPPHMPIHTCPPPTHSHTPELIRTEVEELKSDFNRRIKEVLFNSLFSAYYVAFLPLCFVKVSLLCLGFSFLTGSQLLR